MVIGLEGRGGVELPLLKSLPVPFIQEDFYAIYISTFAPRQFFFNSFERKKLSKIRGIFIIFFSPKDKMNSNISIP